VPDCVGQKGFSRALALPRGDSDGLAGEVLRLSGPIPFLGDLT
jgi:hypothetical protein